MACEESQRVCTEFRKLGHEAYSCDILPCSGGYPEWHVQGDALLLINGDCKFKTMDGEQHEIVGKWDLLIAHPPCTYLSNAGAARLYKNVHDGDFQMINVPRLKMGIEGKDFFMRFLLAQCNHIAIENPIPSGIFVMPKADQTIQPYEFGHPYSKKTLLWLKGLPPLFPTEIMTDNIISWVSGGSKRADGSPRKQTGTKIRSSKERSKTFKGIARAMAQQWSDFLINEEH